MAGLRLHSPMLHPEHYCSQRRDRGQSDWLSFLCKSLSFSVSSRFIPALSLTLFTDPFYAVGIAARVVTFRRDFLENVTMRAATAHRFA